jgi:GT2 family glycosyltransferase
MPFAGGARQAGEALSALSRLSTRPGDQLILVENSGTSPEVGAGVCSSAGEPGAITDDPRVMIVRACSERSPAHARNIGAERAEGTWILFLDADCRAPASLIDDYFSEPVDERVGALAGEVSPAPGPETVAARYGAARGFLGQRQHLSHPYLPRAVAANLMVRRQAFEQVGGFFEGLRAAEDTDFTWRLQQAGWRLELRSQAWVEHGYRTTLSELRRQWRGYAAGRAWLARRYAEFAPRPAVTRAALRLRGRLRGSNGRPSQFRAAPQVQLSRLERGRFLAIDALLAGEELAGFVLSNRPARAEKVTGSARVVLVAERFPSSGDPLIDFALSLDAARVEAMARPELVATEALRVLHVNYREDDGGLVRALSAVGLLLRHPIRCLIDFFRRSPGEAPLRVLAPAVRRLEREPGARVHPLGSGQAQLMALRLAALAGRALDQDT